MKNRDRVRARAESQRVVPGVAAGSGPGESPVPKPRSGRESIESFVVVFLAFLIWSLEAEGFVIPTGSMAPTLMGRHKEIVCPECGYVYTVNADREVEAARPNAGAGPRILWGSCENCRFEAPLGDVPSFSGDRISVMKQGLSLPFWPCAGRVQLQRWDVAVFKLPEEPEVRYIKRLVGMPGEVVRIQEGDLWVRARDGPDAFQRPLRSLDHQQAMQVMVYDDRHRARALSPDPRWRRWSPAAAGAWTEPEPGRFVPGPSTPGWVELRYHHVVPSPEQWRAIRDGQRPLDPPRATLITDYSSYNTGLTSADRADARRGARPWLQPHWVSDLTLALRLLVREPAGRLRLELIQGGWSNHCEIDLASGEASLAHGGTLLGPPAATGIRRPGTYDLILANVDGRLTLWVDGDRPFGDGRSYPADPRPVMPTTADLEPVRIAAHQAAIAVDNLVLRRDVYYTLEPSVFDYASLDEATHLDASAFFDLLANPERFARLAHHPPRDYPIAAGHYLMLGDNSPWSRDSRAWGRLDQIDPELPDQGWDDSGRASWEVPTSLLVGKAFCVYWPHLKPIWPEVRLGADIRLPALPYIQRMRWIR
jgi:signal peptidase I